MESDEWTNLFVGESREEQRVVLNGDVAEPLPANVIGCIEIQGLKVCAVSGDGRGRAAKGLLANTVRNFRADARASRRNRRDFLGFRFLADARFLSYR